MRWLVAAKVIVKALSNSVFFSILADVSFNEVLSDLDFSETGVVLKKFVGPLQIKRM